MNELDLFAAALAIADPAERDAMLDRECVGRPVLRDRLKQLLEAHAQSHQLLDQPRSGQTITLPEPSATVDHIAAEVAGTIIAGKYKLLQQIGEGGMGTVWMADQTEPIKRRVAVKLIRVEKGNSKTILSRFEAERQAIALMDHPHIAKLLDAGTSESGQPYFVMELVKGIPLTDYCDTHKLSVQERLSLFQQICSAVQHAHQKGIIHRDLKPTNILVESHDGKPVPKVIDFGLAKATSGMQLTEHSLFTAFGSVMGTPLYMAPEQANFNAIDVDTRADIYALGVILYELLTGTTPLTRETMKKAALDEMMKLIREQEAPTPSSRLSSAEALPSVAANRQSEPVKLGRFVKGELDWIVLKALSKERDRRYETANGFARDIERFLNHEPVQAGPVGAAYKLRKFVQRNRGQVVAAGLVMFALLAGIAGTTVGFIRAHRAAEAERLARLEAQDEKEKAIAASEEERKAKEQAQTNLAFATKGNEILSSVFAGLDPSKNYATLGEFSKALADNLKRAEKELDGSAIGDPLVVATMQDTLGNSLLGLGEYEIAIVAFKKAFETRKAKLTPQHPDTLDSMNHLCEAYLAAGKGDVAEPLMVEAMKLSKAKLGPDHPTTLSSMDNLGQHYGYAKKLDLSLPLLEETLKLRKVKLGRDDAKTLESMNNLAFTRAIARRLDLALPLYEECLNLLQAKLGPDHPSTLTSMGNLAGAYNDAGRLDKALPLFEETLKLQKAKLGIDHPYTLITMNNLAFAYRAAGKRNLALLHSETMFKLNKDKFGLDHSNTLTSMNNLAATYQEAGRWDKALPIFEETLKLQKATLGPDDPATLVSMNNLAVAYQETGKWEQALSLHEEMLRLKKAKLGLDHPDTLQSMSNLAVTYGTARKLDLALPLCEETLKLQKAKLGLDHPATRLTMDNLAFMHLTAGTQQAWCGQDKELAATCERALELEKGSSNPILADRTAKLCSLRPSGDPSRHAVSLVLARKAVQLGKNHQFLPWFELSLGMAEYRNSHFVAADAALTSATNRDSANNLITGIGAFYRAMSLFRQGKPDEARQVAYAAVVKMKPLPNHEKNQLPDNAHTDDLILWMAYKEAIQLIGFDLADARKTLPKDSPELAELFVRIGIDLLQERLGIEAEPFLREGLAIRQKNQPDAWNTFNVQSLLGGALLGQKKYADAEPLLLKGYEGMKAREKTIPPQARTRIPEAVDRLIELYTVTNKPDEAKKWQAERAKYPAPKELDPPREKK